MKIVRTSSFFQKESEEHPFIPKFGAPANDELKEFFHDAEAIRNRWFVIFGESSDAGSATISVTKVTATK
jgi:hypothetical protein